MVATAAAIVRLEAQRAGAPAEPARETEAAIEIDFEPIPRLVVGQHAELVLLLRLSQRVAPPLMITPDVQGQSVEIVKGRYLRSDAVDPESDPLRFRVHVIARNPGMAVLNVRVRGYVCGRSCDLVEVDFAQPLQVGVAE